MSRCVMLERLLLLFSDVSECVVRWAAMTVAIWRLQFAPPPPPTHLFLPLVQTRLIIAWQKLAGAADYRRRPLAGGLVGVHGKMGKKVKTHAGIVLSAVLFTGDAPSFSAKGMTKNMPRTTL